MPFAIPEWLLPTLILLPTIVWFFCGVGMPWALALLPRADWRRPVIVIATAMALGPALTTTALFFVGTFGTFSVANAVIASVVVAVIGVALMMVVRARGAAARDPREAWTMVDVALIAVIGIVVLLRVWNSAYWPFATYDEFWVYGYNAKVFMLNGAIPKTMGYYPQLVPLSYTFMQLVWGGINDHAARVVVPFFALGSLLMAYLLGTKLFNRRVGLLTAALWALYPQHAVWSQFGDLEVPVTLYFTATAAFFIAAYRERQFRYAVLSGLMLGAALWTKPTAGALIESLGLIAAVGVVGFFKKPPPLPPSPLRNEGEPSRQRFRVHSSVMELAIVALVVGAPMGGMWYIRNVLVGLPPLVLPAGYWQGEAQRSGQELGWLLLIGLGLALLMALKRERVRLALIGAVLLIIGIVPSAFGWRIPSFEELGRMLAGQIVITFRHPDLSHLPDLSHPIMVSLAWMAILGGMACLAWAAIPLWRRIEARARETLLLIAAFVLPYGVTWFWSYSYHFRLSFAIVPLLCVVIAALIEAISRQVTIRAVRVARLAAVVIIVTLALPGWIGVLSGLRPVLAGTLPDDDAKVAYGNPALMDLVQFLRARQAELKRPLKIVAPGELRLGFFFPDSDIRGDWYPTQLDEVADVDYFIDSSPGQRLYDYEGKLYNQILRSLTRSNAMQRAFTTDDGNFRFSAYTILNAERFKQPSFGGPLNVQIGDFAVLEGYSLGTAVGHPGESFPLTLVFRALKPSDIEYSIYIHVWDAKNNRLIAEWSGQPVDGATAVWENVPGAHFSVAYPTRLWQADEYISDDRRLRLAKDAPRGDYELRVGLFDPISFARLPVMKDGEMIGDYVYLYKFSIQ